MSRVIRSRKQRVPSINPTNGLCSSKEKVNYEAIVHNYLFISAAVPRKGDKRSNNVDKELRLNKEGLVCAVCGMKFKSSVQLSDHKSTIHGGKSDNAIDAERF